MRRINSRKLLVGISLVAAGIIVISIGVAVGSSVGSTILAGAILAA